MVLVGVILGTYGSYFFLYNFFLYNRQLGQLSDRINRLQQMLMAPVQPGPDVPPALSPGSGIIPSRMGTRPIPNQTRSRRSQHRQLRSAVNLIRRSRLWICRSPKARAWNAERPASHKPTA